MNKTDERKDAIILILSNNTEFVTAGELAESLEVSEKTIYRTVKEINNDEKIPLEITSEKGKGYKITHINKISTPVSEVNDIANMTPAQRRNNIMQDLLISSPNERKICIADRTAPRHRTGRTKTLRSCPHQFLQQNRRTL